MIADADYRSALDSLAEMAGCVYRQDTHWLVIVTPRWRDEDGRLQIAPTIEGIGDGVDVDALVIAIRAAKRKWDAAAKERGAA